MQMTVNYFTACVFFQEKLALEQGTERTFAMEVLESVYRFTLGSIAGGKHTM